MPTTAKSKLVNALSTEKAVNKKNSKSQTEGNDVTLIDVDLHTSTPNGRGNGVILSEAEQTTPSPQLTASGERSARILQDEVSRSILPPQERLKIFEQNLSGRRLLLDAILNCNTKLEPCYILCRKAQLYSFIHSFKLEP